MLQGTFQNISGHLNHVQRVVILVDAIHVGHGDGALFELALVVKDSRQRKGGWVAGFLSHLELHSIDEVRQRAILPARLVGTREVAGRSADLGVDIAERGLLVWRGKSKDPRIGGHFFATQVLARLGRDCAILINGQGHFGYPAPPAIRLDNQHTVDRGLGDGGMSVAGQDDVDLRHRLGQLNDKILVRHVGIALIHPGGVVGLPRPFLAGVGRFDVGAAVGQSDDHRRPFFLHLGNVLLGNGHRIIKAQPFNILRLFPHRNTLGRQAQNTDLDSVHILNHVGCVLLTSVAGADIGRQYREVGLADELIQHVLAIIVLVVADSHSVIFQGVHCDSHRIGLTRQLGVVIINQGCALDSVAGVQQDQVGISNPFLLDEGSRGRQALGSLRIAKEIPVVEVTVEVGSRQDDNGGGFLGLHWDCAQRND